MAQSILISAILAFAELQRSKVRNLWRTIEKIILKLIALLIAASGVVHTSPGEFFGRDYDAALQRIQVDQATIHEVAVLYAVDEKILCAMVFPEYIRYSYLSGLLETASLEWLYVNLGTDAVDFSIGHFQMKPSFAEAVEKKIAREPVLRKKYSALNPVTPSGNLARSSRINRLKNVKDQATYACAFIEICEKEYVLEKLESAEQLKYLSAIYNRGLQYDKQQIEQGLGRKTFPHGARYQGEQFAYWEVALDYYLKHSSHENH